MPINLILGIGIERGVKDTYFVIKGNHQDSLIDQNQYFLLLLTIYVVTFSHLC